MPEALENQAFLQKLQSIADDTGRPLATIQTEAAADLEEMRGNRNRFAVGLFARISRYLCRRGYQPDYYHDLSELEQIRRLAARQSVVYLITHKTYLDFFVLYDFLYRNGISPPYIFGGVNMAFAGFGSIARRAGGIFIRRTFTDDAIYKAVLRRYIQDLIGEGCSFSWAIEGTRSRTGKLVTPKLGLLKYVVDASRPLGDDAITYIPVSVSYDQIPDVIDMAAQEAGATKKPESLKWFVGYVRGLKSHFGNIYVRFGDPVALHDTPDAPDLTASQKLLSPAMIEVEKLAFEVCYRINEVTPATETSLILMSLLCRTSATRQRIRADVASLENYMRRRQSSAMFSVPSRPIVNDADSALDALLDHGVVQKGPAADIYSILSERFLVALYYSNMAVHHFVIAAFAELGLLNVTHAESDSSEEAFRAEVMRLRDLFKFEFFFSRKDQFLAQFDDELVFLSEPTEALGRQDHAAAKALLRRQPLLVAHGALSPFVNAYRIVARCLLHKGSAAVRDQGTFVAGCQAESRNVNTSYPAFASKALLTNGYLLAENRGLLGDEPDVVEKRRSFSRELDFVAQQLEEIREMTA